MNSSNSGDEAAARARLRARALKLLTLREHSQAELERKLNQQGASAFRRTRQTRRSSAAREAGSPSGATEAEVDAASQKNSTKSADSAPQVLSKEARSAQVCALLEELKDAGYQSDERFAASAVRRLGEQVSERTLKQKLKTAGVDPDTLNDALSKRELTDEAVAAALWARKFGVAPKDDKEKAKQVRFLQSRGFSISVALKVLRQAGVPVEDQW